MSAQPIEITEQSGTVEFELNKEKYKLTISNDANSISFSLEDLLSLNKTEYFIQTNLKQLQKLNRFFTFFDNLQQVNKSIIKQVNNNNINITKDGNTCKFLIRNPVNDEEFFIELEKTQNEGKDNNEPDINDSLPLVTELKKKVETLEKQNKNFEMRIQNLEEKIENVKSLDQNVSIRKVDDEEVLEDPDEGGQIFKSNLINKKEERVIKSFVNGKILSAELLFDTATDGDTIDAFKNKVEGKFPTLFIIKTDVGSIFGGYATTAWKENGPIPDYKSFVYTLNPNRKYGVTMPRFGLFGYQPKENIMFQFGCVGFRVDGKCTKSSNNVIRGSNYEKGFIDFIQGDHKFRVSRMEIFKLNF